MNNNKWKVRVVIRRVNTIRGILIAYLKAFDRHFNLVRQ